MVPAHLFFFEVGCFSFPVASFLFSSRSSSLLRSHAHAFPLSSPALILSFPSLPGNDAAVPCAVVKTVDSFSFLHHPVHQRSLEILQRCKDEKYSMLKKNNLWFNAAGGNNHVKQMRFSPHRRRIILQSLAFVLLLCNDGILE